MIVAIRVAAEGQKRLKPSVYFKPIAQPTSQGPAINKMIQEVALFIYLSVAK